MAKAIMHAAATPATTTRTATTRLGFQVLKDTRIEVKMNINSLYGCKTLCENTAEPWHLST